MWHTYLQNYNYSKSVWNAFNLRTSEVLKAVIRQGEVDVKIGDMIKGVEKFRKGMNAISDLRKVNAVRLVWSPLSSYKALTYYLTEADLRSPTYWMQSYTHYQLLKLC